MLSIFKFYFTLVPRPLRDYTGKNQTKSQPRKKDKYFILSLFITTEDLATLSLDLANDFPEAEESQIRHKEPTPKNIQAEDRQSSNEMMEMLKYMNQR